MSARTAAPKSAAAKSARKPAAPAKVEAPAAPAAKAAPTPCGCGCGQPNVRAEAKYLSGHDARHAGMVGRELIAAAKAGTPLPARKDLIAKFGGSEKLADKALGMVATASRKATEQAARKAAREVAQAAARKAFEEAMAQQA